MKKCEECNKELHILQSYRHPALGKNFSLCGKCFDKINEDMKRWSKFCLFNSKLTNIKLQDTWNKNISDKPDLQKWFNNLWLTKP
jgi:hypothetical protein